jgi:hypothetical protein
MDGVPVAVEEPPEMTVNRCAEYFESMPKHQAKEKAKEVRFPILRANLKFEAGQKGIFKSVTLHELISNTYTDLSGARTVARWWSGEYEPAEDQLEILAKFFGYADPKSILAATHRKRREDELVAAGTYRTGKKRTGPTLNEKVTAVMRPMQKAMHGDLQDLQQAVAEMWDRPRVGPLMSFLVHWLNEQSDQD